MDLLPRIASLDDREAFRFWNGFRTWKWSYRDLYFRIARVVSHLDSRGIGKEDRVLLWAEACPEWVAIFWACLARGVQVIPLDSHSSPEFVSRIHRQVDARLLVLDREKQDTPAIEQFVLDRVNWLPEVSSFDPTPVGGDDIVEIIYTSGTTAEPKGVVHRHRNICANLDPIRGEIDRYKKWAAPFQPIRLLNLLPLSHMFGQSMSVFIPVLLGGATVFVNGRHPTAIRRAIRRERVSVLVCVPRILESLRADLERRHPDTATTPPAPVGVAHRWWRYRAVHREFGMKFWAFVVGGAALEAETEAFWSRVGFLVVQGYGLTETSPVVSVNHPFHARRGTLGKVIGNQEVRIDDDGEILVRGSSVVSEYLESGSSTTPVADPEGWLHTGDLGELDNEGRLVFKGRKKDVIVTPDGLNVHPEDVEASLRQEAAIRDCVVLPVGEAGNEKIHAVLILSDPHNEPGSLVDRVNRRLEAHQRIQRWSIWPEEDFPRTSSTLKIQRRRVVERLSKTSLDREVAPEDAGLEDYLQRVTGRPGIDVSGQQRLGEDLGLSSLERIDLLSWIEERFGLELDEMEFSRLSTVRDLAAWVERARRPATLPGSIASPPPAGGTSDGRSRIAGPRWARSRMVAFPRNAFRTLLMLPLFSHYIELAVDGLDNLADLEGPVIFAANHASHLDTVAILAALPGHWRGRLAPAMRQEHFFPAAGQWGGLQRLSKHAQYYLACSLFNAYPLSQKLGQVRDTLRYTGELVEDGCCPLVFPEGKRTPDGGLQPFRPGLGLMALRLRVPVVPTYLEGMFDIFSLYDSWPRRGTVRVLFGRAIEVEGDDYVAMAANVETAIRALSSGLSEESSLT